MVWLVVFSMNKYMAEITSRSFELHWSDSSPSVSYTSIDDNGVRASYSRYQRFPMSRTSLSRKPRRKHVFGIFSYRHNPDVWCCVTRRRDMLDSVGVSTLAPPAGSTTSRTRQLFVASDFESVTTRARKMRALSPPDCFGIFLFGDRLRWRSGFITRGWRLIRD